MKLLADEKQEKERKDRGKT